MENLLPPSCQSCGVPIKHPTEFAMTASGAKDLRYCGYCSDKGEFTDPDITLEAMITKVATALATKERISIEEAEGKVSGIIESLDRWKKEE